MNRTEPNQRPSNEAPLFMAAGLLLILLVAVGALWMIDRRNASYAERQWQRRVDGLTRALQAMQVDAAVSAAEPAVDRASLEIVRRTVDGAERDVLQLSVEQGRRLGLAGGDLVEVIEGRTPPDEPAP